MAQTQSLDHLILFVPVCPKTKLPNLESFYWKSFKITPGGFHADGVTSNTLILLADGSYIELISFVDAAKATWHWWGPDATFTGWKDWCLTNPNSPEDNYTSLKDTHDEPVPGGRKRADGVDVKWAVTFPKGGKGVQNVRGRIPFFCHDITHRSVRVPLSGEKTKHPCGALGVLQLTVIVKDEALLDKTNSAYTSIMGRHGTTKGDKVSFQLGRVCDPEGLGGGASVVLRLPRTGKETEAASKTGFWYGNVILGAPASSEKTAGTRERLDSDEDDVRGIWVEYV